MEHVELLSNRCSMHSQIFAYSNCLGVYPQFAITGCLQRKVLLDIQSHQMELLTCVLETIIASECIIDEDRTQS